MPLSAWLDARDGETLARAWAALDKNQLEIGAPGWLISVHGAAHLAAAFLGWPIGSVSWLDASPENMRGPIYDVKRTTPRCFLEHGLDRGDCFESFTIREESDGQRGVQYVTVACRYDDGTREGGGTAKSLVRVFDRRAGRGASIGIGSRSVATIGEVDLTALDLFDHVASFHLTSWTTSDLEGVRGLMAQLAAEVDAHFDVSTEWPGRTTSSGSRRFQSGSRAVDLNESRFSDSGWVRATVHGLPWGWRIELYVSDDTPGTYGNVNLRLPLSTGQAVMARLAHVPGLELS